jgi:hypothetical protein
LFKFTRDGDRRNFGIICQTRQETHSRRLKARGLWITDGGL